MEVLAESKPFEHSDFYSSLKKRNISKVEYADYLKLYEGFSNRLEYFLAYNKQDTIIMIPIINKLIKGFAEQKVDILRNISLSVCASQAKFATLYDQFNIDDDYSIRTISIKTKKQREILQRI
jgi:hypothetical protein